MATHSQVVKALFTKPFADTFVQLQVGEHGSLSFGKQYIDVMATHVLRGAGAGDSVIGNHLALTDQIAAAASGADLKLLDHDQVSRAVTHFYATNRWMMPLLLAELKETAKLKGEVHMSELDFDWLLSFVLLYSNKAAGKSRTVHLQSPDAVSIDYGEFLLSTAAVIVLARVLAKQKQCPYEVAILLESLASLFEDRYFGITITPYTGLYMTVDLERLYAHGVLSEDRIGGIMQAVSLNKTKHLSHEDSLLKMGDGENETAPQVIGRLVSAALGVGVSAEKSPSLSSVNSRWLWNRAVNVLTAAYVGRESPAPKKRRPRAENPTDKDE